MTSPRTLPLILGLCLILAGNLPAARAGDAPAPALDPHQAHSGFRFQDSGMDFVFGSLVLGSADHHGCEVGEAFAAAANIQDGDAASWQAEWMKMAARIEARGEKALAGGHAASAREQFLRAAYAWRLGLLAMLPDDPRLANTAARARTLMRRAGALLDPPLEYFEIPFEGTTLPGYFRAAARGGKHAGQAPTLIMIGGAETFAEDQYFYIAPQAFDRGWNFLTVDLPGQGLLPLEGRFFRPDMEVPFRAVVDYALSRPDVDPARVAAYGISSGGGFVPMAAVHEKRLAAVVMNNCVVDAGAGVAKMAVATATPEKAAGWSSFKRQNNQLIAWRFGVPLDNLPGLVAANEPFRFDPARVAMPAFIVAGEGEWKNPEIERQNRLCLAELANPAKDLVVTPSAEGAANHCVMENRALMSQVVFDWLDRTLGRNGR